MLFRISDEVDENKQVEIIFELDGSVRSPLIQVMDCRCVQREMQPTLELAGSGLDRYNCGFHAVIASHLNYSLLPLKSTA